jgi:transcriptional regulator GlxA family with amidase domain
MRIDILVFNGADEIDFVGPQEVFRRAAKIEKDIEVELVTLEPQSEVTAQFGLRVHPDGVLNTAPDLVVVPGGGWVANSNNGIRREIAHGALTKTLSSLHESQVILAGVCTGAMALAAAGLLDGRAAVTHHGALEDLRRTKARVVEARVVDDGDILTCGGVTSSIDLALWFVERQWGGELADKISRSMEHSRTGIQPRSETHIAPWRPPYRK